MAPTGQLPLPASFSRGLTDFQKRLSAAQIEEFQFATFQTLQDAIHKIQREQAQRKSFRNLNKIRPFLNGLSQYSKVIELFINMEPLLAAIWVCFPEPPCYCYTSNIYSGANQILSSSTALAREQAEAFLANSIDCIKLERSIRHSARCL
jgi:hypothetical protein